MERKILSLTGINTNNEVTGPENISCIEMINTRYREDAWREIKSKSLAMTMAREYDEIFIHTSDTVKNWIGWSNTQNKIYWFDGTNETEIGTVDVGSVKFNSVGNVLVIYTKTGDDIKVLYSLFDKTTSSYSELLDFEFDVLDVQFYKQQQKYPWMFAHRVMVGGQERINWIGLKLVGDANPWVTERIVYCKENSDIEIKRGSSGSADVSETNRAYPKGIAFVSDYENLWCFEAYNDGLTNPMHVNLYKMQYDPIEDRYFRMYLTTKCYEQYEVTSAGFIPKWDEREPTFILNDTDADGITEPLSVSAGETTQKKYEIVEGAYSRDKALAQSHGFFEGFTYVTYAFKMFDGNYIKYSFPKLLYMGEEGINLSVFGKIISDSTDLSGFKFNTLGMYIKNTEVYSIYNLQKYEKLILSLDIFMTKPVSRFDFTNHNTFVQQGSQIKELSNTVLFYKIYSIPLKDLTKYVKSGQPLNGGSLLYSRLVKENREGATNYQHYNVYINTFFDLNTIESNETLPVDNYTSHVRYADSIFKYNNRLMISNTIQKLYKGLSPNWFLNTQDASEENTFWTIYFEVVLETEEGIKYVKSKGWRDAGTTTTEFTMPDFFGYPDNRATKLRILIHRSDLNELKLIQEIELTKHLTHNFSYYLSPELYQQYILELESNNIFEVKEKITINLTDTQTFWATFSAPAYPDGPLNLVNDNNKISITEVNNPFIFPAKYTYQVGNSEIIGLASNADPVSQGQFGQYPIIVFTKTGIWTLNISESDAIYISNITPLNGDVCTNKDSIVNIEGSILFVSGEDIKMLRGGDVTIISDVLKGLYRSKAYAETIYQQIVDSDNMFANGAALSSVLFITYMAGAKFAYDRINSEFIVTNPAYNYSYIFSAKYKLWYKLIGSWSKIIQDYPEFYGIATKYAYNLSSEAIMPSPIFIESQAIEFTKSSFVKLNRIKLYVLASMPESRFLGIYFFGSIDGEKWGMINAAEFTSVLSNPILNRSHISIKYIKLVISSEVNSMELKEIIADYDIMSGKIR